MDIKIKRDICTTTWELKANMNNRQDKEKILYMEKSCYMRERKIWDGCSYGKTTPSL